MAKVRFDQLTRKQRESGRSRRVVVTYFAASGFSVALVRNRADGGTPRPAGDTAGRGNGPRPQGMEE